MNEVPKWLQLEEWDTWRYQQRHDTYKKINHDRNVENAVNHAPTLYGLFLPSARIIFFIIAGFS